MDLLWGNASFTDADLGPLGFGVKDEVTVFHAKENEVCATLHLQSLISSDDGLWVGLR